MTLAYFVMQVGIKVWTLIYDDIEEADINPENQGLKANEPKQPALYMTDYIWVQGFVTVVSYYFYDLACTYHATKQLP
eukprot:CAMPEP_0170493502 /NCGR_PEP_ID=MMETSP0208-20121228/14007_1 /TAXON_ID=197538 /ORGANISM="Strombidium inclinatum, Strain S3" /LENGTH=77 /DNA_ID=CAMNT_0010769437 /DNA_START=306 /DNA_END=539 /DNA_ORIENTATION=+